MRVSGFAAVAVMVAGAALMPTTASAAVFTLNTCVTGDCGSFSGSVTITIGDNVSDTNDVDFSVVTTSACNRNSTSCSPSARIGCSR